MGGNASNAIPGAQTRRGPAKVTGLALSDHIGSVRTLRPPAWMSTLACPTMVARKPATRASGMACRGATECGHGAALPESFHRSRSRKPRSVA